MVDLILVWEGLMMSETLDPVAMELDQRQLAEQLLAQAKEQGVDAAPAGWRPDCLAAGGRVRRHRSWSPLLWSWLRVVVGRARW
jgi:hypothetical protein